MIPVFLTRIRFSTTGDRIRFRDIWNITWLDRQKVQPNPDFVTGQVIEFGIKDFGERLATMPNMLQDPKTQRCFREEMLRFLPLDVITSVLDRPGYMTHVTCTVDGWLSEAVDIVAATKTLEGSLQYPDPKPFWGKDGKNNQIFNWTRELKELIASWKRRH